MTCEDFSNRAGFRYEGRQVQCTWYRGAWVDRVTMAILEREWKEQQEMTRQH